MNPLVALVLCVLIPSYQSLGADKTPALAIASLTDPAKLATLGGSAENSHLFSWQSPNRYHH